VQRDLLRIPEGDAWTLRVSVADIDRDGPFSVFPGTTRCFAVLDGGGVALTFADGTTVPVGPTDDALVFDGASAPACSLVAGPVRALNLMTRSRRATLFRAVAGVAFDGAPAGLLACTPGRLALPGSHGEVAFDFAADTLAWFDAASSGLDPCPLRYSGTGWWIVAGPPLP